MPGGISILMWKVAVAALINASSKVTWVRVGVHARRVSLLLLTNTPLDVMPKHRSFCYKENVNTNATSWIDVMQLGQKQKRKSCTHASLQLLDVLQEVPEERGAPLAPFRARGAHRDPRGCAPGDHQYDQQQTAGHTCTQTEGPVREPMSCTSLNGSGPPGSHRKERSPCSRIREIWTAMHPAVGLYIRLAYIGSGIPSAGLQGRQQKEN